MFFNLTIQQKITGLLICYFVIAFVAITSTLFVSGRLEGGAAAINDAGSERMRSYQIGFLLAEYVENPSEKSRVEIDQTISLFEETLKVLKEGDPRRPLLLPKDQKIRSTLDQIQQTWSQQNKIFVTEILNETDKLSAVFLLQQYSAELKLFVAQVDKLVVMVEKSQANATRLLRNFQNGLISLAFVGTILLISLFMKMVITPVKRLKKGMDKMGQGEFSIRLPVNGNDELADLAAGYNQMAKQLQEIYDTLEERIGSKTKSIELKSRELGALYDTASFLNTSTTTETMCDGVLGKMVVLFGAKAGVIRLVDKREGVPIIAYHGVSEEFLAQENQLQCGDCLCGDTAKGAPAVSQDLQQENATLFSQSTCVSEGFKGVVSVPIKARQHVMGVFNLFFQDAVILPPSELKLLETISQHLASAIENQLFVTREKDMAISEERNLLAQELHDSIAQSLAFLNIQAQLMQESLRKGQAERTNETLDLIREGIQESYDDVRELLVHFRTRIKHDDIEVAINDALEKFEGQTSIKTHYESEGHALTLQPEIILQFLHIMHECLSNIRKHSQATQVDVHLSHGPECQLFIHDDGIGFDTSKTMGETHVGLQIMKERAHRIKGTLTIDSSPQDGTTICLSFPRFTNVLTMDDKLHA
jgi:two-component system, NarL family, nitrate/nitrite sensor histidine kinase NarX